MSAFDQLASRLAQKPGVTDPRGLAAAIGRKRYGSKVMAEAAAKGVSAKSVARRRKAY